MRSGDAGRCVLCVVGARPNFMKIAPVIRAMRGTVPGLPVRLVHMLAAGLFAALGSATLLGAGASLGF